MATKKKLEFEDLPLLEYPCDELPYAAPRGEVRVDPDDILVFTQTQGGYATVTPGVTTEQLLLGVAHRCKGLEDVRKIVKGALLRLRHHQHLARRREGGKL